MKEIEVLIEIILERLIIYLL